MASIHAIACNWLRYEYNAKEATESENGFEKSMHGDLTIYFRSSLQLTLLCAHVEKEGFDSCDFVRAFHKH